MTRIQIPAPSSTCARRGPSVGVESSLLRVAALAGKPISTQARSRCCCDPRGNQRARAGGAFPDAADGGTVQAESPTEFDLIWLLACVEITNRVLAQTKRSLLVAPEMHALSLRLVRGSRSRGPRLRASREQVSSRSRRRVTCRDRAVLLRIADRVIRLVRGLLDIACDYFDGSIPNAGSPAFRTVSPRSKSSPSMLPGLAEVRAAMKAGRAVIVASGMPGLGRRTLLVSRGARGWDRHARDRWRGSSAKRSRQAAPGHCEGCKLLAKGAAARRSFGSEHVRGRSARELVAQLGGRVLVTTGVERPAIRWDRPTIAIELAQPTSAQRATLGTCALGAGSDGDAELLAERHPLAPALVTRAAAAAKVRATGRAIVPEDIYAGIRAVLDDKLGQYGRRVTVTQTWDDLVLPPEQLDQDRRLLARVRGRRCMYEQWGFAAKVGKGLGRVRVVLGPPGTGKTMVAARADREGSRTELYPVDLGKLVSKWIGETEKQLGKLFDAAEDGHAVLLFDEADALFGKRTDVKSSNDRYANLETNYLLQRLETCTGICLLTSNHETEHRSAFPAPALARRAVRAPRRGRARAALACRAAGRSTGRRRGLPRSSRSRYEI